MQLYTAGRDFLKEEIVDSFESVIWVERYYGDGDFELNLEATGATLDMLPKGKLMLCESSAQPMILESREIKEGLLQAKGITLTQWLNNRPFRTASDHNIKEYVSSTRTPGQLLTVLVQEMCIAGDYLDGTIDTGISTIDMNRLAIPGLVIGSEAPGGSVITITVPFGPLYDILKEIATTYEIGLNINLDWATEAAYQLSFNSYVGTDRTSAQTIVPAVQFSPDMDTFSGIMEMDSILDHKNLIQAFVANTDAGVIDSAGRATSVPDTTDGFDLRVHQEFVDLETVSDPDTDPVTYFSEADILARLNQKAESVVQDLKAVQLVDGEIVPNTQIRYDTDYYLGDIVEVIGNSGALQPARITEYIRAQDSTGKREYPTLAMID